MEAYRAEGYVVREFPAIATSLRLKSTSRTWVIISGRLNRSMFFHSEPVVICIEHVFVFILFPYHYHYHYH